LFIFIIFLSIVHFDLLTARKSEKKLEMFINDVDDVGDVVPLSPAEECAKQL